METRIKDTIHISLHFTHNDGDAVGCAVVAKEIEKRRYLEFLGYPQTTLVNIPCLPSHVCEDQEATIKYIMDIIEDGFKYGGEDKPVDIDVLVSDLGLSRDDLSRLVTVVGEVVNMLQAERTEDLVSVHTFNVYDHHNTNILNSEDGMRALRAHVADLTKNNSEGLYVSNLSAEIIDPAVKRDWDRKDISAALLMFDQGVCHFLPHTHGFNEFVQALMYDISAYDMWRWKNDPTYRTCLPLWNDVGFSLSIKDRFPDIKVEADFVGCLTKTIGFNSCVDELYSLLIDLEIGREHEFNDRLCKLVGIYQGAKALEEQTKKKTLDNIRVGEIGTVPEELRWLFEGTDYSDDVVICFLLAASESNINAPAAAWLDEHAEYTSRMTIGIIPATRAISIRARGCDASKLAVARGGGGHLAAAGATLTGDQMADLLRAFYHIES